MAEVEARALRVVGNEEGGPEDLVGEYLATLGGRSASTVDAYFLRGFPFSGLPHVAPYCVRGGVRVVSEVLGLHVAGSFAPDG
jgi:hypothetical protein